MDSCIREPERAYSRFHSSMDARQLDFLNVSHLALLTQDFIILLRRFRNRINTSICDQPSLDPNFQGFCDIFQSTLFRDVTLGRKCLGLPRGRRNYMMFPGRNHRSMGAKAWNRSKLLRLGSFFQAPYLRSPSLFCISLLERLWNCIVATLNS